MKTEFLHELILRSFSEPLNETEQKILTEELAKSDILREKQAEWKKMHHFLHGENYAPNFKPLFAERVMQGLEAKITPKSLDLQDYLLRWFPKVALAGFALILLLTIGLYGSGGDLSLNTLAGIGNLADEESLGTYIFSF